MADRIFTGKDRATELGCISYRLFIEFLCSASKQAAPNWEAVDSLHPLSAFVDHGRWLAECECGEAYYVDPDYPLGYCPRCGNVKLEGKVRSIEFPANRAAIEQALLERKMLGDAGVIQRLGTQAAHFHKLVFPEVCPRNWMPGQTIDELRAEVEKMKQILAAMKEMR